MSEAVSGAVLDTGAIVAFERSDRRVVAIVARALEHGDTLVVPAGVVAQARRDGSRQTRLARLLGSSLREVVQPSAAGPAYRRGRHVTMAGQCASENLNSRTCESPHGARSRGQDTSRRFPPQGFC